MDEAPDIPVASVEDFSIPIEIQVYLVYAAFCSNAGSPMFALSGPATVASAKGSYPPALSGKMRLANTCVWIKFKVF
jgi:hypothetical protein